MKACFYTLTFFLILAISPVFAATITTHVDRSPVVIDESFQIIFESSKSPDDDPDFSLLKKDFDILNRSKRSNTTIINGDITSSTQWILTVMAKQTGMLKIPPVAFGKDRSQAATIEVLESRQGKSDQVIGEIFIEVEASTENPYVQAQVIRLNYFVQLRRIMRV